jgi:hypothetical protein
MWFFKYRNILIGHIFHSLNSRSLSSLCGTCYLQHIVNSTGKFNSVVVKMLKLFLVLFLCVPLKLKKRSQVVTYIVKCFFQILHVL